MMKRRASYYASNFRALFSKVTPFLLILALTTCDTFTTEQENPTVTITQLDELSLLVNHDVVIPMNTWITSPVKLKIEIIEQPRLGYIESKPNGDFKYTPYIDAVGDDNFTFTVRSFSNDEELLPPQTVPIHILEQSGPVSCNFVAVSDVVESDQFFDNHAEILPITNDLICDAPYYGSASSFEISIYRPSEKFMPHHGTVYLVNPYNPHSIEYWPDSNIPQTDTITYKLTSYNKSIPVSYGMIFITPANCKNMLRDDYGDLYEGKVTVDLLANDNLCKTYVDVFYDQPRHGVVEEVSAEYDDWYYYADQPGLLSYVATDKNAWIYDTVVYKICNGSICDKGRLIVSAMADLCVTEVREDIITYNTTSGVVSIDVMANDNACNPTSLSIRSPAQHGALAVDALNNRVLYTPRHALNDAFQYVVCNEYSCTAGQVYLIYKRGD